MNKSRWNNTHKSRDGLRNTVKFSQDANTEFWWMLTFIVALGGSLNFILLDF